MSFGSSEIQVEFVSAVPNGPRQFARLYRKRIDRGDQVRSRDILRWLRKRERSVHSDSDISRLVFRDSEKPCHLLLGAWREMRMVGFANIIFLPTIRAGFLPYFAVERSSYNAVKEILKKLKSFEQQIQPGVEFLVFEFSRQGSFEAKARARLFSKYLEEIGWHLHYLDLSYRIPSVRGTSPGFDDNPAFLMIAQKNTSAGCGKTTLHKKEALEFLKAIYFGVYAEGLAYGSHAAKYRELLQLELNQMEQALPEHISLTPEASGRKKPDV